MTTRSVVLASCLLATSAMADTITLTASQDNTLYQSSSGALSNGSGSHFFAGRNSNGDTRRGLLGFDLSALPANAQIVDASLTLNLSRSSGSAVNVGLHLGLSSWGEGSSHAPGQEGGGAPAATGDATWLHRFFATDVWATAGGDFAPVASALTTVDLEGEYTWSSSQMVADIQAWVADPGSNSGWTVLGDEIGDGNAKRFDTRENSASGVQPELTITYIPAPASTALLLAGLGLTTRRRNAVS